MKFVFLNRALTSSSLVSSLRQAGHAVFICTEARETEIVLKLHGKTVSLVMGHDQPGLELITLMKASPKLSSIPIVLTHSTWTEEDFGKHRRGVQAASAYHSYPIQDQELFKTFSQILKTDVLGAGSTPEEISPVVTAIESVPDEVEGISLVNILGGAGPVLEDVAAIASDSGIEGGLTIDLPAFGSAETNGAEEIPSTPMEDTLPDISESLAPATAMTTMSSPMIQTSPTEATEIDPEAMTQMPYLQKSSGLSPLAYSPPMTDALVPGGAAQSPDVETLKKYLMLREQDVLALSAQLKQTKDQLANVELQLRHERAVNTEFAHLVQEQGRRIDQFEKERQISDESAMKEVEELKFELKRRTDRAKLLEHQIREASHETEKLKERVRLDIRKIRVREKELENRLEIMKKDSEALLTAREQKIVEVKRKLDLTEFNMDLLQEQLEKERALSSQLRGKLEKAAQVVRVAGGLLHPSDADGSTDSTMMISEGTKDPAA